MYKTQEEKAAAIAALEAQFGELTERLKQAREAKVEGRWKPEMREKYYYIVSSGKIDWTNWMDSIPDNTVYKAHNCFRTKPEAQKEADRLQIWRTYRAFAREKNAGWKPDWDNSGEYKWGIKDYNRHLTVDYNTALNHFIAGIAFRCEEHAHEALKKFGDRLLLLCDNE